jgi:hypothetical protein
VFNPSSEPLVYGLPKFLGFIALKWIVCEVQGRSVPRHFYIGAEQTELQDYKDGAGRD